MRNIRVFFEKTGMLKYISHLDLQRTINRTLSRSGLEVAYSEGFNPHYKLSFALPMSVYHESTCEMFDMKISDNISDIECESALRKVFPEGLVVVRCREPKKKFSEIYSARYEILLETELEKDQILSFFDSEIIVRKKTKKGESDVDISKMVFEKEAAALFGGGLLLRVLLSSGNNNYLNPDYLVAYMGEGVKTAHIKRTEVYDEAGRIFE